MSTCRHVDFANMLKGNAMGYKIKGRGKFSFDRITKEQENRIRGFPTDEHGRVVRLGRFPSLPDNDVIIWRDHIIRTFKEPEDGEKPYPNPLRFIDSNGREPELSMMKMGSSSSAVATAPKKTAGRAASKKDKRSKSVVSETEEESDHSDTPPPLPPKKRSKPNARQKAKLDAEEFTPDKKVTEAPAPKSSPGTRSASVTAMTAISKQAKMEAIAAAPGPKIKFATASSFTGKGRPGSLEGRKLAARRIDAQKMIPASPGSTIQSMYLQRPGMKSSTLVIEWKALGWNSEKVRSLHFRTFSFDMVAYDMLSLSNMLSLFNMLLSTNMLPSFNMSTEINLLTYILCRRSETLSIAETRLSQPPKFSQHFGIHFLPSSQAFHPTPRTACQFSTLDSSPA